MTGSIARSYSDEIGATGQPALDLRGLKLDYTGPERDEPSATNVTEVLLGWFGPSDPKHELGGGMWTAVCLAIEEANQQGGFGGTPFRLVAHWSENPWTAGIGPLFRMVYDQRLWALLGSIDGPSAHLAEQVAVKARLPLISPVSSDKSVNLAGVPWMFSCTPGDHLQAPLLVHISLSSREAIHEPNRAAELRGRPPLGFVTREQVRNEQGVSPEPTNRIVMLSATDHDSRAAAKEILRAFMERKRQPDFRFEFDPGTPDLMPQLSALRKSRPRTVLIVADPIASARALVVLRQLGTDCEFIGTHHLGHTAFLARAGQAAEGVRFPLLFDPRSEHAETAAFVKRFTLRHGNPPDYTAACAYDASRMLIEAVRRGGLNRARIREALVGASPWRGLSGSIRWDGTGQNLREVKHIAVIQNGRVVQLQQ